MNQPEYDYDVAISFVASDEALALQICDALAPLRVFVYSKVQEEVTGDEGVATFREVFRNRARVSLVLHRSQWAKTKWTRVEETAIRDHCLDAGWDHLMFVRLEREVDIPRWIPDSYIYLDFESFGLSDLVGAMKAKLAKFGVQLRQPTAADHARLIAGRDKFNQETKDLLWASTAPFDEACADLFAALERALHELEEGAGWRIKTGVGPHCEFVASVGDTSFQLLPKELHANSAVDAYFKLRLFSGRIITPEDRGKHFTLDDPMQLSCSDLRLDRVPQLGWCWRHDGKLLSTEAAAAMIIETFVSARKQVRVDR